MVGVLACLSVWDVVQICIWSSWCHCHALSLAPVNPDWFYQNGSAFLVPAYPGCRGKSRKRVQLFLRYRHSNVVAYFYGSPCAYCDEYELLCLFARITRKPYSRMSPHFCACCLWLWFGPPLTALWLHHVLPVLRMMPCFRQWVDSLKQNKVAGQTYKFDDAEAANTAYNVRQLQCLVVYITMWHQGQSLLEKFSYWVTVFLSWGC